MTWAQDANNNSNKAEIINVAEYLNTNYKEDQFVIMLKATKALNQIWTR